MATNVNEAISGIKPPANLTWTNQRAGKSGYNSLTAKEVVRTKNAKNVQLITNCVLTATKRVTSLKCAVLRRNMY